MFFNQKDGLSRQARKTLEAIKDTSIDTVDTASVNRLLECLGFKRKTTGTHITWRHPKGYRVTLVFRQRDDGLWGWELKKIRNLIKEIEEKESVKLYERGREKMSSGEVNAIMDDQAALAKKMDMTKLDLSGVETKIALSKIADAFNKSYDVQVQTHKLIGIMGQMLKSTQDYILELEVKIEGLAKSAPTLKLVESQPEKPKMSRKEAAQIVGEKKKAATIAKIKETQKLYPNYAKNPDVIAAFAKIGPATVHKYYKEGLV